MNLFSYSTGNDNAGFTVIENIFINEYMADAKGDYVKVYLYGLKNSQNPDLEPLSTRDLASILDLTEADVLKALDYWENKNLIQIDESGADRKIRFLNISSLLHYPASTKRKQQSKSANLDERRFQEMLEIVQKMLGGEPVPDSYIRTMHQWIDEYGFEPEAITLLVEYSLTSMSKNGRTYASGARLNYMKKVAETWAGAGVKTYQQAQEQIDRRKEDTKLMYAFLSEMRISGNASPTDYQFLESWKKDLGFSDEMILEAARRADVKKFNYVNSMLRNWHEQGLKTVADLSRDAGPKRTARSDEGKKPVSPSRSAQYEENLQEDYDWFYGDVGDSDE